MSKLGLLAAGAVGYVLGTRAGREQYAKIKDQAQTLWSNPKVQDAKAQATEAVSSVTASAKSQVKKKASDRSDDSSGFAEDTQPSNGYVGDTALDMPLDDLPLDDTALTDPALDEVMIDDATVNTIADERMIGDVEPVGTDPLNDDLGGLETVDPVTGEQK